MQQRLVKKKRAYTVHTINSNYKTDRENNSDIRQVYSYNLSLQATYPIKPFTCSIFLHLHNLDYRTELKISEKHQHTHTHTNSTHLFFISTIHTQLSLSLVAFFTIFTNIWITGSHRSISTHTQMPHTCFSATCAFVLCTSPFCIFSHTSWCTGFVHPLNTLFWSHCHYHCHSLCGPLYHPPLQAGFLCLFHLHCPEYP